MSKNRNAFLRLLKNMGLKNERMTKVGLYAIDKSTTLESNKSLGFILIVCVQAFLGLKHLKD